MSENHVAEQIAVRVAISASNQIVVRVEERTGHLNKEGQLGGPDLPPKN